MNLSAHPQKRFPVLLDCKLRMVENKGACQYYLVKKDTGHVYTLDSSQVGVISLCDGSRSLSEICKKNPEAEELIKRLVEIQVIRFKDKREVIHQLCWQKSRSPHPAFIVLEITGMCNLRCKHCYDAAFNAPKSVKTEFTTEQVCALLNELDCLNTFYIQITGGEPFLRSDLFDILKHTKKRGLVTSAILTNGTLLTQKVIENLKSLGVKQIVISLDGLSLKSHEELRGGNTFRQTLRAIEEVDKEGLKFAVTTMITKYNLPELQEMYKKLFSYGNLLNWRLGTVKLAGRYKTYHNLFEVRWNEALDVLSDIVKEYVNDKPNFSIEISNFFRSAILTRGFTRFDLRDHPCKYAFNDCCIRPNGDVYFCATLAGLEVPEAFYGNIFDSDFYTVWYYRRPRAGVFKRRVGDVQECRECKYIFICGGGCLANAYSTHGNIYSKDPYTCAALTIFESKILKIMPKIVQKSWFSLIDNEKMRPKIWNNLVC